MSLSRSDPALLSTQVKQCAFCDFLDFELNPPLITPPSRCRAKITHFFAEMLMCIFTDFY